MKTLLPNPAILSMVRRILCSWKHQLPEASCDYGRIENVCQSKLLLSLVSILKATKRCQLLHLSARTRCRWSLRFQVSYLTLLFRRTNRFGPVDFLPRIFAEVTALRHKVMPRGDRFRSIQISVDLIAAITALEIRLTRTDT